MDFVPIHAAQCVHRTQTPNGGAAFVEKPLEVTLNLDVLNSGWEMNRIVHY